MAASGVADIAVGFEWTPFAHGFAFWEDPGPEHLPPPAEAGQREWLEGFLHAYCFTRPELTSSSRLVFLWGYPRPGT